MSAKAFQNCSLDLQRAATAFYLNPQGKTHRIFLTHAQKILNEIKNKKAMKFARRISQIERVTRQSPKNKTQLINLADKILTQGILLK